MKGWRKSMEDAYITDTTSLGENTYLFSVFYRHGGSEVSKYLQENKKEYELALIQTFKKLDESLITSKINDRLKDFSKATVEGLEKPGIKGIGYSVGSTAWVALIILKSIFVANLGDSRYIISKNGKAYEMSIDHKPNLDSEKKRILAAGGYIKNNRIQGNLNLRRSFGNMNYKFDPELLPKKQMVINIPEIWEQPRNKDVDFIFIAWDGIWEWQEAQKYENL